MNKDIQQTDKIVKYLSWFQESNQQKIEHLKNVNKPSVGFISIYTPEEVLYAAGLVPFRITGEKGIPYNAARASLFANLCPYILSCLEEGMKDIYDFSSGIVIVNSCDARRRLYDAWKHYTSAPFVHLLDFPKIVSSDSKDYFKKQIILLIKALEKHFKCNITENSLLEGIYLCNKTRGLIQKLYNFRKNNSLAITSDQMLDIVKAGMGGSKEEFNVKLKELIDLLGGGSYPQNSSKKVLLTGSYFDQIELIKLIENSGATVVCEDISNGFRYCEGYVDLKKDPITAISEYYLEKAVCARIMDSEKRFNHISKLIEEYKADAVIYYSLKFCDNNLMDYPYQKEKLKRDGIPVLFLEGERSLVNLGQIKTRVQAFLDIL